MTRLRTVLGSIVCWGLAGHAFATEQGDLVARDKAALAPWQAFVGEWRGVGQPKRGSNQGAWTEESAWAWKFESGRATIESQTTGDKIYRQFQVRPGEKSGEFTLLAVAAAQPAADAAKPAQTFAGRAAEGGFVFTRETSQDDDAAEQPARITLRLVAGGDRMLILYEKRLGQGFARLAEVGATRKGSSFAKAARSGPECVVTGGLGTIAVTHQGKTYYVCCTGCRDLFQDNPEGVLEEYRQRKAAEKAEKQDK